eukprot:scaffold49448_cov15-Tisochrysis_lutea.AAC.5
MQWLSTLLSTPQFYCTGNEATRARAALLLKEGESMARITQCHNALSKRKLLDRLHPATLHFYSSRMK